MAVNGATPKGNVSVAAGANLSILNDASLDLQNGQLTLSASGTAVGPATVNMLSGNVNAAGLNIGDASVGRFTQSGGGVFSVGFLDLGQGHGAGTYALSAGSVIVRRTTITGDGLSAFDQTGGSHVPDERVDLFEGTYNLGGGTLATGQVVGDGTGSTFNFGGGTLTARVDTAEFLQDVATANVRAGLGAWIDSNGFDVTVAQTLLHSTIPGDGATDGGLTKIGAGRLSLTGANKYTGGTVVTDGTLSADNVTGSATGTGTVTVLSCATLAGRGRVNGPATVNAGATLAPGNSPGRLTLGASLSLPTDSALAIEIGGAVAATGYDQVVVAGPVTLGGALNVSTINDYVPPVGTTFFVLEVTGLTSPTGTFSNVTPLTSTTGMLTAGGTQYLVNYAAHDPADASNALPNDLSLTVVPEPATASTAAAAAAAAAVGLLGRRRKRTREQV